MIGKLRWVPLASVVLLAFLACGGCGDERRQAAVGVQQELAQRRADQAKSMELYDKGMDEYRKGKSQDAKRLLLRATDQDRRNARAWMALGLLAYDEGQWYQAANAFHRAARLEPNRYEPQYNLGLVLEEAGQCDKAVERYEAALKLSPDNREVMENLARCYVTLNTEPQKALDLMGRSLRQEIRPEWVAWLTSKSQDIRKRTEVANAR